MASVLFGGGKVFDATTGAVRSDDVLISDTRIVDVGHGLSADEVVDCSGAVLVPGLMDCHAHLGVPNGSLTPSAFLFEHPDEWAVAFPQTALRYLEMGITTVRDAGFATAGLKSAIRKGIIDGPRMQISISILSSSGGHSDFYLPSGLLPFSGTSSPSMPGFVCDGVDECALRTRELVRAGADVIKICVTGGMSTPGDDPNHATFSEDEIRAFVDTARDLGRPVMAHAHGAEGIKRAIRAGVRSIEHGTFIDEEAAEMMVETGTWLVPTLTTSDASRTYANDESLPEDVREKMASFPDAQSSAFRLAAETGVKIAMGTDCPIAPHGTNLRELEHMATNGLSPEQSLMAATSGASELLNLDNDLGTIEPGKIADIVIIDGDPFEFETLDQRILEVWKDGNRVVGRRT